MRFCVALLTYSLFLVQSSHSQVTIWYEQMAGDASQSSNAWSGDKPFDVYNWGWCPPTFCWYYQSAGSYQLTTSTTLYSAVQLTYSIEANELSGSESCYIQYSVDGTIFNSIETITRDSGYTEALDKTYDAWTDAAGIGSLTIKFGSSKAGATCAFNRFTLSGILITSNPSTDPTNHPSLSPSVPTQNPSQPPTVGTLHPSSNPSQTPTKHPTATPTAVTIHPTPQPSISPTLRPSSQPTVPPTCGGNQRCYAADMRPVHNSHQYAAIYAKGYGFNAINTDYIFLFTIVGDSPCINPRLTVLWQRVPTRISVYLGGDYVDGCYDSGSSCGGEYYYYCVKDEPLFWSNEPDTYYPGTQWSFRLDHNTNNACNIGGTYVHLSVKVELKCWSQTPQPTRSPTVPTLNPTDAPTIPSLPPTNAPSFAPTQQTIFPTTAPTFAPSQAPSFAPSQPPTLAPSFAPTLQTISPTNAPTLSPSQAPSLTPSQPPTLAPSQFPTLAPSNAPTLAPSDAPSSPPTLAPSQSPTASSLAPTTGAPSPSPTPQPTVRWTCAKSSSASHRYDYWERYCYAYDIEPVFGALVSQTVAVSSGRHSGDYREYYVSYNVTGSDACMNPTLDFKWEPTQRYYSSGRYITVTYTNGKQWKYYYSTAPCGSWVHSIKDYSLGTRLEIGHVITLALVKEFGFGYALDCGLALNAEFTLTCDDRPPTNNPTFEPSKMPSNGPSNMPTASTKAPSKDPTTAPTAPTAAPTAAPTMITSAPTTASPTTAAPTTDTIAPTRPTTAPTRSTSAPSKQPTRNPTNAPTVDTIAPTTANPTNMPTAVPTADTIAPTQPTTAPTQSTSAPSKLPTRGPTNAPSVSSSAPTVAPTAVSDAPTRSTNAPTTNAPTLLPTKAPTTELCANANAFCYTADVYSASTNESTLFSVDIQNTDGGEVEIYDVYFTARNGACYAPSIGVNYTAMYDANLLTILDANDKVMAQCQTKKECGSYSECVRDYNLGIRTLYEHKTYVLRVFGRYLSNGCNGTDTVELKIDFVCDLIPPPSVAPTGHPIAPTTKTPTATTTTTAIATNSLADDDDSSGSQDGELSASDAIEANMAIVIVAGGVLIALIALCCCIKWKKTNDKQRLEQTIQSEDDANTTDANMTDIHDNVLMELGTVLQSENEAQAIVGATDAAPAVVASNDEN